MRAGRNPWRSMADRDLATVPAPRLTLVRTRTRAALVWLALLAIVFIPTTVDLLSGREPGGFAIGLSVLGLLPPSLIPDLLALGTHPARQGTGVDRHLLTARTAFGPRAIDLDRLRSIRLVGGGRYGAGTPDRVLVTDGHGVRLSMPISDRLARTELRNAVDRRTDPALRVSATSFSRLGCAEPRPPDCRDGTWTA
ncbi:MAG TPA: hypothetical protein VKB69_11425, partial [Micromonosporaceae bacterium]|nr:hypothetical protein [Micromonosporaceae bacterium]